MLSEVAQDSGTRAEQQPLVFWDHEAEMTLRSLSSAPPGVVPLSRPVEPVPVGLSDKDLARLRAEGPSSEQLLYPSTSELNVSQSTFSLDAVNESGGATSSYDSRRLQSEVESLRREMDRLRTEGVVVTGAPPSYTEGDR